MRDNIEEQSFLCIRFEIVWVTDYIFSSSNTFYVVAALGDLLVDESA